jgi:RNase P subunit RPR2
MWILLYLMNQTELKRQYKQSVCYHCNHKIFSPEIDFRMRVKASKGGLFFIIAETNSKLNTAQ